MPVLVCVVALACSPFDLREPAVGEKSQRVAGDDVELVHFPTTGFARLRPGVRVLREKVEWSTVFRDTTIDFVMPHGPEVDWKTTMALVATATDATATGMVIERVVRAPNDVLHVYVNEELRGDRCEPPTPKDVLRADAHEPPIDIVTLPSSKLPLVIHLDRAKGLSCDPLPVVNAKCHPEGKPYSEASLTISAAPGDVIECDGTNVTTKVGYVAERNWYFERKPVDSFTSILVDDTHTHAKFSIDAFGEYRVRMEAVDDRHKTGDKKVQIDVAPDPETQVIQVGWTLHGSIDPKTLPQIEPHFVELGTGRECSEAHAQLPWCEVKVSGLTKQLFVKTQKNARYKLSVTYLAARPPQMPVLCARAFVKGATVALETCDFKERDEKDVWEPGAFNPDNGSFGK